MQTMCEFLMNRNRHEMMKMQIQIVQRENTQLNVFA